MDYKNFFTRNIPEKQFENKEKIKLPGGEVEIIDIKPSVRKTKIPVVLGVGWGGKSNAYKNNILSLANSGRRVIVIDAVHGIDYDSDGNNEKGLPNAELRKVAALITVLDNKNIKKVDAIGYSEGAIYITLAAILHPKKFRNLVLVNPGGMIGKDKESRLTAGFLHDLVKNFIKSISNKDSLKRFAIFYGGMFKSAVSDIVKAVNEISAISDSQIQEFLRDLKKKGIGISIIHSTEDYAFPITRMKKFTKPEYVDHFYSVKGYHGDFVMRAEKYTDIVDDALNVLEDIDDSKLSHILLFKYFMIALVFIMWLSALYYVAVELVY